MRDARLPTPAATHEYLSACAGVLGPSATEAGRAADEDAETSGATFHSADRQLVHCRYEHYRSVPGLAAR